MNDVIRHGKTRVGVKQLLTWTKSGSCFNYLNSLAVSNIGCLDRKQLTRQSSSCFVTITKKKATSKLKNKLEWMVEGGKFRGLFLLKIFVAGT